MDNPIIIAGVVGAVVVVIVLIYIGVRGRGEGSDPLMRRLLELSEKDELDVQSLEELELSLSFKERILIPILQRLAEIATRFTPEQQLEATRHKLDLAGNPNNLEPSTFFLMRIGAAVFFGLAMFFVFVISNRNPNGMFFTLGGIGLGYFLPVLWLRGKISSRQGEIVKALPDALDLLTICVEAGLGFDQAMGKIYEKWDDDLSVAFGRILQEIQLGKVRREAMRDMAERMDVADVTSFVAAIVQAEQLGVSMTKILRIQSDQMRVKRRQRAQEKAQQAPVKIMIPLVFLIFPSIFIVLLGPAVIFIMDSGALGAIGQ